MTRFLAGVMIGFISFGIYTAFYPLGLRSTIRKLVELDYGEYNSKTGEFVLKECKKDQHETSQR